MKDMLLVIPVSEITQAKLTVDKKFKFTESKSSSSVNFR